MTPLKAERLLTPQARTVLDHLRRQGSITNVEAHNVHRIRSVSRRITEINDALTASGERTQSVLGPRGYVIRKAMKKDVTGQRYVRYFLTFTKA